MCVCVCVFGFWHYCVIFGWLPRGHGLVSWPKTCFSISIILFTKQANCNSVVKCAAGVRKSGVCVWEGVGGACFEC